MAGASRRNIFLYALLLIFGLAFGYLAALKFSTNHPQSPDASSSPIYLVIGRQPFPPNPDIDGQHGYLVSFNGYVNQSLLLTQAIEGIPQENTGLIEGEELKTDEYEWTGVKTKIIYVRNGSRLQIQREIQVLSDDPEYLPSETLPRDVLLTLEIPGEVAITFSP